ncbi:hypothetical protein R1flu_024112 [Riccia fluitans]|uniref:Uncharacterized protein n=1 Tax=Riccia fluitans TaxID=41844 RepID=A0ABD1XTZ9_9MARC
MHPSGLPAGGFQTLSFEQPPAMSRPSETLDLDQIPPISGPLPQSQPTSGGPPSPIVPNGGESSTQVVARGNHKKPAAAPRESNRLIWDSEWVLALLELKRAEQMESES